MFSGSESEDDQNVQLTINEHYAKAFQHRKEREELDQLKAKYGSDFEEGDLEESTESESAESEDEEGEELTPAVDAAILRTLARIRKKDPAIYDSGKNIFGEEAQRVSTATAPAKKQKKDKSKPVTIRQQNLDAVLHGSRSPSPEPAAPTHVQEQEALRSETIKAFETAVGDDNDDFLVPREKTRDEVELEEEEYKTFLEKHVGDDLKDIIQIEPRTAEEEEGSQADEEEDGEKRKDTKKKDKKKKDKGKARKNKEEEDQEFLLNYILNRGWVDQSAKRVPTYHEITGDGKKKGKGKEKAAETSDDESEHQGDEDEGLLSDASFESLASVFEVSYNHRFEEPGADTIPSFPRQIESTIRREENPRKAARERKRARKEEEMAKKREEVKRMKALKVKEIKRKLEKIGMESGLLKGSNKKGEDGNLDNALQELDLEGEWDPEKHDQQLQTLFAGEGDDGEEGDEMEDPNIRFDEDGKPVWDDDIDLGDIPISDDDAEPVSKKSKKEKKKEKKKKKKGGEDGDEGMGVDVDAMDAGRLAELNVDDDEDWDGTEEMRKRKWKEYMDSLYELDFNDMVGDMPTRFNYVPVGKQNYSLDPVEILMADDKDLNEYMSIKKYAPYRQEKGDRSKWDKRQQDKLKDLKETLKKKQRAFGHYDPSAGVVEGGDTAQEKPKKKRMGKKERMKAKVADGEDGEGGEDGEAMEVDVPAPAELSSKKKRKREGPDEDDKEAAPAPESGAGADEGAKRKKRRRRPKKTEGAAQGQS
ncbi:hypothetical protein FA13DRAFT_1785905 [Coprinellus micaceus]|uniref:Kri1-like C-terminal domain-containing protein n=1 Tax=Coprinellus micaceus TaxID=71717 RepID=A0A4Y7TV56_COPMI|nr:hypothetical protein FA13DRAFT_1785905 [Coprinellus micaceus]